MNYLKYYILLVLLVLAPFTCAGNTQDDGRTYFTVNAFSMNEDNATFNAYGTGQVSVSLTDGIVLAGSTYTDDVLYYEMGLSTGWIEDNINLSVVNAPGTDTQVIFNDGGVLAGDASLTWNKTTNVLTASSEGASISIDGVNDTITATGGLLGFDNENLVTTGWWAFNKWDITGTTPTAGYLPYVVSGAGDVATMGWKDPATIDTTHTLDEAYDDGDTIDYSSGNGPVEWRFPDNGTMSTINGQEVMNLFMDTDEVDTASAVMQQLHWNVDAAPAVAKFLSCFYGLSAPDETFYLKTDGTLYTGGTVYIKENAAAAADIAGVGQIWVKNDAPNTLWFTDDAGTDFPLRDTDTNTHTDTIDGYLAGTKSGGTFIDQYAALDPAATIVFAGTGVNDIVGYSLPWNVSIVGISANYQLLDAIGVSTVDIFPYEDGAAIHANCKLTLAETAANRDSVSATFAAGTYTVSANQTINIYVDVTNGGDGRLTNLIVTVYYHYSI